MATIIQGSVEPIYRCTSCGAVYLDKVTQCDCMPKVQEFLEGIVTFPKPFPYVGGTSLNALLERLVALIRAEYEAPLKLAEEALASCEEKSWSVSFDAYLVEKALAAIREALAEPQITTPDVCGEVCERAKLCYGCGKNLDEANRIHEARLAEPVQEPVAWTNYNGAVNNLIKAEQALQNLSDFHQHMEATEPKCTATPKYISQQSLLSKSLWKSRRLTRLCCICVGRL